MIASALSLPATAPPVAPAIRHRRKASRTGPAFVLLVVALGAAGVQFGFVWWLTMLAPIAFAAAMIGLLHPAIGLYGISLLCTLDTVMRAFLFDGANDLLPFNTLNYWLLIVILVNSGLIRRFGDAQTRLFIGFIVLLTVELVFSERVARGAQHILGIATLFGVLVYFVRAAANDRAWYWQGVISGTASAVGCLLYNMQRGEVMHLNPNVRALLPETGIFAICLAFGFALSKREEFVLVALAALNVSLVFLTSSRGGLFISLASLLFLLLSMRGFLKKGLYTAAAVLAAIVISGWFGDMQAESIRRLEKLWSADESVDARTSGRSSLAIGGWHIFLDNLLGVGTGGSELAWAQLDYVEGVSDLKAGEEYSLHSGWIKVLAENGIPGIVMFVAVVFSFAARGWMTGDRFLRALGLSVTLTLTVAFISTEFQGKGFWFLAAGALTLLNREHMLAAVAGGKRHKVWWVRPTVTRYGLKPQPVGTPAMDTMPAPAVLKPEIPRFRV
jgi:hypothetical protein